MWHLWKLIALGFICIIGTGCSSSLVGAWAPTSDSVGDGEYSSIQFRKDGSFSAVTQREGEDSLMTGKYDFDGFALTLKPPGKAMKSYRATYVMNGTLDLKGDGIQQKLKKK